MKPKLSPIRTSKPKPQGNYLDTFVKKMFGRVVVFVDFLLHYADKKFVAEIDTKNVQPAPTHYIGLKGDERIVDLVFQCPLKNGGGNLMAVIVFEHQSGTLKRIPQKLHKYISTIWDAEMKEGKPLSAPYFIVLRTGKRPHRKRYPMMADLLPKGQDGEPIGNTVEVTYDVVDLPNWNCDTLIGGAVLRSSLIMLHTTTGGNLDDFPKALLPLLELPEGERIEVTKELIDFVAHAFAAKHRKLEVAVANAAVKPILQNGEQTMKTIFEEREAIGEARGEARGKSEAGRKMVLTALRTKFKRVPKSIEKVVLSMSDPIALESLLAQVIQSNTMEEFAEVLR